MTVFAGTSKPTGRARMIVLRRPPARELRLRELLFWGLPRLGAGREVNLWRLRNLPNLLRGLYRVLAARALRIPTHYGAVYLEKRCGDGRRIQYGLASLRVVTDAGVDAIIDAFQNLVELENFKYHGFGTGATAEAAADAALVTELTTEYAVDNTRPTGTLAEGAAANVFRTVGTLSPDSGGVIALTEHGVFSQAATGGGTLLDRSKFAVVSIDSAAGDSLQVTYDFTIASGG